MLIYILHLNFAGWWRTWGWEVPRHASILGWCSETVSQRYGWLFYLEVFWHCTPRWSKSLGLLIYYFFQCQVLYDCNSMHYVHMYLQISRCDALMVRRPKCIREPSWRSLLIIWWRTALSPDLVFMRTGNVSKSFCLFICP